MKKRWLVKASLRQFLDVVDRVAPPQQWEYRRTFWTAVHEAGLIDDGTLDAFQFGDHQLRAISCSPSQTLLPISEAKSPDNKAEALSFALALKATRDIDSESALDAIAATAPTHAVRIFLQVNIAREASKRGALPAVRSGTAGLHSMTQHGPE